MNNLMGNSMECHNCGTNNKPESNFCEKCGFKLDKNIENENDLISNGIKCLKCQTINDSNSKFCKICGSKISNIWTDENNVNQNNKSINTTQMVICPYCNFNIPQNSLKCGNCGEWIDKSRDESNDTAIVLGYIFTFLGGLIGIIFAIYLGTRDNERANKHGIYMLIISLIYMIILIPITNGLTIIMVLIILCLLVPVFLSGRNL